MKMRDRFIVLTAACAVAALTVGGCKDSDAQQRATLQEEIAQAGRDLYEATAVPVFPGDESFQPTRQKLTAVIGQVSNLTGGEEGQQAAGSLIAAAAHRKLATMSLAQAQEIEAEHRRVRFLLTSGIDAAVRLEALAADREAIRTDVQQAMLDRERQAAQEALGEHSRRMAELDGPITERRTENEQDAAEAARLNEQARTLRREASELGHADGLARFEQAVLLERQADRFEYEIAKRDNDLRRDLEPEHGLAAARVAHLQTLLGQIDATQYALEQREQRNTEAVDATRSDMAAFRDRISELLPVVSGAGADELNTLYDDAADNLGQAVTKAQRASGRGGSAARLVVARAYELQGQLYLSQARGLADHMALLQRLVTTGGTLGPAERFAAELQAMTSRHEEALQQSKTALEAARQQLMQVTGNAGRAEVDAFRASLDASLAAMGGEPPVAEEPRPGAAAGGPEELVAMINAIQPDDLDAIERLLDRISATTPEARQLIDAQRSLMGPTRTLMAAIGEQFGEEALQAARGGMNTGMGATNFRNMRLVNQTADRATVSYDTATATGETLDLVLVNGTWMMDGDALIAGMNPAEVQQGIAAATAMADLMNSFAQRITAGEFATPDAALQAMMMEMMSVLGATGGGGP